METESIGELKSLEESELSRDSYEIYYEGVKKSEWTTWHVIWCDIIERLKFIVVATIEFSFG